MAVEATVFIVDNDERARKSVCALVRSLGVRAEAYASAEEFLGGYRPGSPGCLVTDIRMLGMSGLDLQDRLVEQGIRLPVIVLTAYPRTRSTVRAMKAGGADAVGKALRRRRTLGRHPPRPGPGFGGPRPGPRRREIQARAALLTPAERLVMNLIVQGKPNKTIAKRLDLSTRTVESRRHEVFAKMGVESVAELVRLAIDGQLI